MRTRRRKDSDVGGWEIRGRWTFTPPSLRLQGCYRRLRAPVGKRPATAPPVVFDPAVRVLEVGAPIPLSAGETAHVDARVLRASPAVVIEPEGRHQFFAASRQPGQTIRRESIPFATASNCSASVMPCRVERLDEPDLERELYEARRSVGRAPSSARRGAPAPRRRAHGAPPSRRTARSERAGTALRGGSASGGSF